VRGGRHHTLRRILDNSFREALRALPILSEKLPPETVISSCQSDVQASPCRLSADNRSRFFHQSDVELLAPSVLDTSPKRNRSL
jgi:hypothetical protein